MGLEGQLKKQLKKQLKVQLDNWHIDKINKKQKKTHLEKVKKVRSEKWNYICIDISHILRIEYKEKICNIFKLSLNDS